MTLSEIIRDFIVYTVSFMSLKLRFERESMPAYSLYGKRSMIYLTCKRIKSPCLNIILKQPLRQISFIHESMCECRRLDI